MSFINYLYIFVINIYSFINNYLIIKYKNCYNTKYNNNTCYNYDYDTEYDIENYNNIEYDIENYNNIDSDYGWFIYIDNINKT